MFSGIIEEKAKIIKNSPLYVELLPDFSLQEVRNFSNAGRKEI